MAPESIVLRGVDGALLQKVRVLVPIKRKPWHARRRVAILSSLAAIGVAGAAGILIRPLLLGHAKTDTRMAGAPGLKKAAGGASVRWKDDAVTLVVDDSMSTIAPSAANVVTAAIGAWRASGANLPSVSTVAGHGRQVGYQKNGPNENVMVFAKYGWTKANGALAVTLLTYDTDTGVIVDGDLLVNGGGRYFALLDPAANAVKNAVEVAIDGSGGSDDGKDDDVDHGVRFDLQSVLTHELGHWWGLGEDYDEPAATMYAKTRAGETSKRILTATDSSTVQGLYADRGQDDASAKAGCGGATIAKGGRGAAGGAGHEGLFSFGVATLGLVLWAGARRSRRARRVGAVLSSIAGLAMLMPPAVASSSGPLPRVRGDADARVTSSVSRWVDGLVETDLTLRIVTCHVKSCPAEEQRVTALGGQMGRMRQVASSLPVPARGATVGVSLRGAQNMLDVWSPFHAVTTHLE